MHINLANDRTLTLLQGDITEQEVDAIVNAANSSLMGGGGVDGAIHRAGGPAILEDCRRVRVELGKPLPAGHAVSTVAGRLKARCVIHTVGPVWNGGAQGEPETLANCYRNSLRIADELKLRSIAFPSVSTGAYGYPVDEAAHVALAALKQTFDITQHVRDVRFVLFDGGTLAAYERAARKIFAPAE